MYAVLDVETTGGKYNQECITDIAIYKYDGNAIIDQFISLVQAEKKIQPFVVRLTGITDKMLRNAPKFHEIAKRIIEITENCILVGHNIAFDYRMLALEFKRLGYTYERSTICTIELAKTLIPQSESYKLSKLSQFLGIPHPNKHRAEGDALATLDLFKILFQKDANKTILNSLVNIQQKRPNPNNILKIIDSLPNYNGVYYMYNKKDEIIYYRDSKNIKNDVTQLFLGQTKESKFIQSNVQNILFEQTSNFIISKIKVLDKKKVVQKIPSTSRIVFPSDTLLVIVDNLSGVKERSFIFIENKTVVGYGFFYLNFQLKTIKQVKRLMKSVENNFYINQSVSDFIVQKKFYKLKYFE